MPEPPPPGFVDLRSDTNTKPSPRMRAAMADAVVGNAAQGEDPTVNELERRSAEVTGKEAALFVPSGTMGNQVAIRVWTSRKVAPEVILESRAHIYLNEAAAIATVAGAQVRPLPGARGQIPIGDLESALQPDLGMKPQTALIALENTHNYASGAVLPLAYQADVRVLADRFDLPVHLDGARVFNAATALGVPVARVCEDVDSVQFCFSKGLGAPVGSMLCGSAAFIKEAWKVRQYLGGALRQGGVIAAPALVSLDDEALALGDDHRRARALADGIKSVPGLRFNAPETNILVVDVSETRLDAPTFAARLKEHGVGFTVISPREVRAVTHRDVDDAGIAKAVAAVAAVAAEGAKAP